MSDKEEVTTQETKHTTKSSAVGRVGIFIVMLALVAFAGAFGYGYFELSKVNVSLARTVNELKQQVVDHQNSLSSLQQSLSSNATQEPVNTMSAPQADLNKFYVMEAQSLTKLAGNHLNVTRDAAMATVVLQHAQEVLSHVSVAAVEPIRQALAANIASLTNAQQVNVDQLYAQLSQIYNSIDQLQLPPTPLTHASDAASQQKNYGDAPWWKIQWHKTMDMLRKIVIVRYTGANEMPLILPEEKMFLYQNLHAQLEVAMLGLMNRNQTVYSGALEQARVWIQHYFQQDETLAKETIGQLQALQNINIVPPPVDLAATMQMFDQYLAQNNTQANPVVTQ